MEENQALWKNGGMLHYFALKLLITFAAREPLIGIRFLIELVAGRERRGGETRHARLHNCQAALRRQRNKMLIEIAQSSHFFSK